MSKYNRELKCRIAKQCLEGVSSQLLSEQYAISSRQIRYWSQVFAIHGSSSFLSTHHASTALSKLKALRVMWDNGWSITHTSAFLNLSSPGTLSVWLKKYEEQGMKGLESCGKGRPLMKKHPQCTSKSDDEKTLEELKEELAYLRAENAVLKKLEELERAKSQQIKKKRK